MNCRSSSSGRSISAFLTIARISSGVEGGRWLRSVRLSSVIAAAPTPASPGWLIPRAKPIMVRRLKPRSGENPMLIVDSQIHIWENAKMSAHHRQIPTYSEDDALKEMAEAGVDAAVIHPPPTLGVALNALALEAVKHHPDKFCILGNFDLQAPNKEEIVRNWRQRPGMLGFRF